MIRTLVLACAVSAAAAQHVAAGTGVSPSVVLVPGSPLACAVAANTVLSCHYNGPAGTTAGSWVPPDLSTPLTTSPCCATNLLEACGSIGTYFDLFRDVALLDPVKQAALGAYVEGCPASKSISTPQPSSLLLIMTVVDSRVRGGG